MPHHLPDPETFRRLASQGNLVPVRRRLFSDRLTPVEAYRRLVRDDPRDAPSFLLESVEGGERQGRFSMMGAQPHAEILAHGHAVRRRVGGRSETYESPDPLIEPAKLTADLRPARDDEACPFIGGWVGYAGYDTVRYAESEKLNQPPPDDRRLPDMHFALYYRVVVFDHVSKTISVIVNVPIGQHPSIEAAYRAGCDAADEVVAQLERPATQMRGGDADLTAPSAPLSASNMTRRRFETMVEEAKKYIAAGDIFQVVLSQRFERITRADPFDIYRALRVVNPSPYMFYMQAAGCILVASSPEILCRVQGGVITNRPLAGTRRRGATAEEDARLERQLLADPKERAEHIMLVDLGRNDVGRVARAGSIALPEVMTVERYSHVMHISSTVTGRLREGLTAWDALRASLPVGTVSGAPKVRAMQIIDELEPVRRGPYAGAAGYAGFAGDMDMAIALRTMVVTPADAPTPGRSEDDGPDNRPRWRVDIQAGAGIVADSVPASEYAETVSKAAALAKAVDVAESAFTAPDRP